MVSAARNIYDSQGQASQGKRVKAQRNTRELDVLPIARPFHMQAEPLARIKQSRLLFFLSPMDTTRFLNTVIWVFCA